LTVTLTFKERLVFGRGWDFSELLSRLQIQSLHDVDDRRAAAAAAIAV